MPEEHISIIASMIKANSRVLILGQNQGLERALKNKKCDLRTRDIDSIGSFSKGFDHIVVGTPLNSISEPSELITSSDGVLSEKGTIIFIASDMTHLGSRISLVEKKVSKEDSGPLFDIASPLYSRQTIEALFGQANYGIDQLFWADGEVDASKLVKKFEMADVKQPRQFFDEGRRAGPTTFVFIGSAKRGQATTQPPELPIDLSTNQVAQVQSVYEYEIAQQRQLLEAEIDRLKHKEARLISSLSWRLTVPLRLANGIAIKLRQRLRLIIHGAVRDPRLQPLGYGQLTKANRLYKFAATSLEGHEAQSRSAAIVHLYYTDSWPAISSKLQSLHERSPFDLFVTLPSHNKVFSQEIIKDFPTAKVVEVPNRGRDVLPFVQVASQIKDAGYEYVLKLHSKKSPHRDDGNIWFNGMLESLVPEDAKTFNELEKVLQDSRTGVVGPEGQYTSLLVNYEGNSFFFLKIMRRLYGRQFTKELNDSKDNYGFFAGTMFWARFDALDNVLAQDFRPVDFQSEGKHIDGTIAHALERVFCVVPEIDGKLMYEVGRHGLRELVYESADIPEWSDLHPSNRKTKKNK